MEGKPKKFDHLTRQRFALQNQYEPGDEPRSIPFEFYLDGKPPEIEENVLIEPDQFHYLRHAFELFQME